MIFRPHRIFTSFACLSLLILSTQHANAADYYDQLRNLVLPAQVPTADKTPAAVVDPASTPSSIDSTRSTAGSAASASPAVTPKVSTSEFIANRAADLVDRALSLVGVRYRRGGSTPESGLDCSGLVRYVFHDSMGLDLPHRAEEISRLGEKIGKDELRPGDLVFYNTLRRGISHVGIYLGEGQFIHAPATGGKVRIEDMNQPYWIKRFSGARRFQVNLENGLPTEYDHQDQ